MRIALLEDEPAHAAQLVGWLREAGHIARNFGLTRELQKHLARESFDLFLLDWALPDMSGADFLHWLRKERNDTTPAIFITSRESEDDVIAALKAGADDYLVKPVAMRIAIARIEAVMRRYTPNDESRPVDASPYQVDFATKTISLGNELIPLTQKEFELAVFLFRNIGRQLSRGHLLETIWGRNAQVVTRTVDTHISRLRIKLQLQPEKRFSHHANLQFRLPAGARRLRHAGTPCRGRVLSSHSIPE